MSISSSTGFNTVEQSNIVSSNGKTLYVGGSGPGNYTRIQDAIDNTSDGDTVFVFNGTYYENVEVNKSINLFGEDKNTTVIDGGGVYIIIQIVINNTIIRNFTLKNDNKKYPRGAIRIGNDSRYRIHNITISNMIIMNCQEGIKNYCRQIIDCEYSHNSVITDGNGFKVGFARNASIHNNSIQSNYSGIDLTAVFDSLIINNEIIGKNGQAIYLMESKRNIIYRNQIIKSYYGVIVGYSYLNSIKCNNFIGNYRNAEFYIEVAFLNFNQWDGNYWNRSRIFPFIILGFKLINILKFTFYIPSIDIDWRPAQEPYDIEV